MKIFPSLLGKLTLLFEKKIDRNKFNNKGKLSVVFDRAIPNVYENNIFPTLPCAMAEIREIKLSQHSNDGFYL